MKHPLPKSEIPLRMPVGNHSDGSVVEMNLHQICPLFITRPDKKSWHPLLRTLVTSVQLLPNIHWIVYLDQETIDHIMPEIEASGSLQKFVIDDPESGTATSRKQWVRSLINSVKKPSIRGKKKKRDIYICIIDDIWDLIRRSDRSDAKRIQHLIRTSSSSNLRIIAGSSAGHRSLFPELLANRSISLPPAQARKPEPVNPNIPGTELILGTEGLVFSSKPGGHSLEKWYAPTQWMADTVPNPKEETSQNPVQDLKIQTGQTQEILPENAALFPIEPEGTMPFRQTSS